MSSNDIEKELIGMYRKLKSSVEVAFSPNAQECVKQKAKNSAVNLCKIIDDVESFIEEFNERKRQANDDLP